MAHTIINENDVERAFSMICDAFEDARKYKTLRRIIDSEIEKLPTRNDDGSAIWENVKKVQYLQDLLSRMEDNT